jgi:Flp pilus assembly protein TadG
LRHPPRPHAGARAVARLTHLLISEEEGASLVEFALVSSMLLLPLVTFIMSFGSFMSNQMQLINAVDVGARTVAVNGGITLDPCSIASSAIIAAAPNLKTSQLTFSYSFNGVPYSGTSCASATLLTGGRSQSRRRHNRYGHRELSLQPQHLRQEHFTPSGCTMNAIDRGDGPMTQNVVSAPRRLLREQNGQVIPWVALMGTILLGIAGLVLDLGRAYIGSRELQSATDAAALAGAQNLKSSNAATIAKSYSALTGSAERAKQLYFRRTCSPATPSSNA